jgi:RND superfamily putative drug exporter
MNALASWCFRRRGLVTAGWLLLIAVLAVLGRTAAYSNTFTVPGTDSTTALNLLTKAAPGHAGDQDSIVWRVDSGTVQTPAVRDRITAMLGRVASAPAVASVTSPYDPAGAARISKNGTIAYATVTFAKQASDLNKPDTRHVMDLAQAARAPGLHVELGGQAIGDAEQPNLGISAGIGILAAAVILFFTFGSLMAMLLPLAVAIFGLASGLMTISLVSHGVNVPSLGPTLATLIALGVGVDYALFVMTRHRGNLKAGMSPQESAVRALNTAGRAVLFAGTTVCLALLGLLVLRLGYLSGLGISAAVAVLFTMAAAVTLLPALLGFLGMRALSRSERRRLADDGPEQEGTSGRWPRWAALVQRRPVRLTAVAVPVMLILTIPFFSLRLGSADQGNNPASTTTHNAYNLLAEGFGPGFNGPLELVATTGTPTDEAAFAHLATTLKAEPGVAAVSAPSYVNGTGVITVVPTTSPEAAATTDLITHLRDTVFPAGESGTSLRVHVGSSTAVFGDFATVISGKLPLFITVIVAFGFVLLLLAFRSLLIPATAAVMNLLAAGASFGVMVAVFQFGWGLSLLNLGQAGPVQSFLPVLMLAVLFGLSTDYEVFLVSRMHEEWVSTGDNHHAVRTGQATTGRVITAAAAIMVCVFGAFVLSGQQAVGEFGLGLGVAVLLDALIVRTVIVPALMHLLGRANWWLPGWLDRVLPHMSIEPAVESAVAPVDTPNQLPAVPTSRNHATPDEIPR